MWYKQDKHAIARRRVEPKTQEEIEQAKRDDADKFAHDPQLIHQWVGASNYLSRKICEELGYVEPGKAFTPKQYEQFRDQCLTCHGGFHAHVQPGQTFEAGFEMKGNQQPGIKCTYCHQVDQQKEWVNLHSSSSNPDAWRQLTPDQKTAHGMRDLVNTRKQAALCNDCHIGNVKNNQMVTHAMYAAGHPPLPSIELETFAHKMPQHWRTSGELYELLTKAQAPDRDRYFQINFPEVLKEGVTPDQVYWNTRTLLISAVQARRHWIQMIQDAAGPHAANWGDYALFDCAACHHELRTDSQRQARGYPGAPGRPRQIEWPYALVKAAAKLIQQDQGLLDAERKLEKAFASQPFGHPAACNAAAAEVDQSLVTLLANVESMKVDAQVAQSLVKLLASTDTNDLIDYHAARQVAWALEVLEQELRVKGAPLSADAQAIIRELGTDQGIAKTGISTQIPATRGVFIYPDELKSELERRAIYDGANFKRQLEALSNAL